MRYNFRDTKILVVDSFDSSRRMLTGILQALGAGTVHGARDATEAYSHFQKHQHDIIIAELRDGSTDVVALAKKIGTGSQTPILAVAGPRALKFVDMARAAGVSDLLQSPYSADDVANRLSFLLGADLKKIKSQNAAYEKRVSASGEIWPEEQESFQLTHLLLDHYTKHHEIVLAKLKFAHSATKKCIDEVRATHQKVKERDNVNILEFGDFNKMWEDIITMFRAGGLSEDDISEIEKLITKMPVQIRDHYDDLSQQDKTFLTLVESLNRDAYRKAKHKVMKLQLQPNPFSGRTSEDYKPVEKGVSMEAFFFDTSRGRPV